MGKKCLGIFSETAEPLLIEEVAEYSIEGKYLSATLPLSDSLRRIARCRWKLENGACERVDFSISQPTEKQGKLPEDLLAYAFFESVLLGADFTPFLCEELQGKERQLTDFLGKFESVLLTDEPNVCGLLRKKAENLFECAYYRVEIENNLIIDVKS